LLSLLETPRLPDGISTIADREAKSSRGKPQPLRSSWHTGLNGLRLIRAVGSPSNWDAIVPSANAEKQERLMNTDNLTNDTVKTAIEALQNGDRTAWSELFEPDAMLFDDGNPRSLQKFTDDALGHERFTAIERVENQGLNVIGAFHSDTWGDFRTYFRFHLSPAGKIKRLEIGQAG
jgi:hypothetical protein